MIYDMLNGYIQIPAHYEAIFQQNEPPDYHHGHWGLGKFEASYIGYKCTDRSTHHVTGRLPCGLSPQGFHWVRIPGHYVHGEYEEPQWALEKTNDFM